MMRVFVPAALVALTALFAGCGSSLPTARQPSGAFATTPEIVSTILPTSAPATPTATQPIVAEAHRDPSATPEASLGPEWQQDSDGNAIPDLVEQATGYDPLRDDCAARLRNCGTPEQIEAALLLTERPHNLLLLLDSSGSMAGMAGGEPKMEAAKAVLNRYIASAPAFLHTGLIAYGHTGDASEAGKPASCAGPELLAPPGAFTAQQAGSLLAPLAPTGWTPIAGALRLAGQTLSSQPPANNRIVLISDGLETCGGDPLAELRALQTSGISVTVDVVGFAIDDDVTALRELAEVGGGRYYQAASRAELDRYFDAYYKQLEEAIGRLDDQITCAIWSYADYASCCSKQFSAAKSYLAAAARKLREQRKGEQADQLSPIMSEVDAFFEQRIAQQRAVYDKRLQAALKQRQQLHDQLVAAIRQHERAAP